MERSWPDVGLTPTASLSDLEIVKRVRAGESALMLRASYDFSSHGLDGVTAYALRVHGSGVKAPAYNEDETNLNLEWVPKNGALKDFSFRTRYAHVNQRGGGDPDINDFRIIVNYVF